MNDEMKKLLSRFLFVSVLISSFGLLTSGSITASERSAKNAYDEAYAVMSVKTSQRNIQLNVGEKEYSFDLSFADRLKSYEDYIMLTPFSAVYYFVKSVKEIIDR